jgi:hypothetical protein
MGHIRKRVWQLCGYEFYQISVNIDTTVETVYGSQQGARKGHNPKGRGKKGYRPVLCFIDETREYLCGKLRKGKTIDGNQAADFIRGIKNYLPGCVKQVVVRADGEFFGRQSVQAAIESGFKFIIANRKATPLFDPDLWYRPWKRKDMEFNSCYYQPGGWPEAYRFVAMRIAKDKEKTSGKAVQCELFEEDRYTYRVFCTNLSARAHAVIADYDKRADVENLVGEAKREGLDAIPSSKFKNNYAFFQIVMLAYNIWRYMKMMAQKSITKVSSDTVDNDSGVLKGIVTNTVRIARLKLLFIAAKVVKDGNRDKVKYSIHDARTPTMVHFLEYLDKVRLKSKPWIKGGIDSKGLAVVS